jgi:hypothetical protein
MHRTPAIDDFLSLGRDDKSIVIGAKGFDAYPACEVTPPLSAGSVLVSRVRSPRSADVGGVPMGWVRGPVPATRHRAPRSLMEPSRGGCEADSSLVVPRTHPMGPSPTSLRPSANF